MHLPECDIWLVSERPTSKRKPKGQLLAAAPEAESKGGLKTDKDKGLQGFASISSGYSNYSPK